MQDLPTTDPISGKLWPPPANPRPAPVNPRPPNAMNVERLIESGPHIIVMIMLIIVNATLLRAFRPEAGFGSEIALMLAVVAGYILLVKRLGIAPEHW